MSSDLHHALAARAAGENAPDVDPAQLDRRLEESESAKHELEELSGLVSMLRTSLPPANRQRIDRFEQALALQAQPRWGRRLALAAAVLLTVSLLASGLYWGTGERAPKIPLAMKEKVPPSNLETPTKGPTQPHQWIEKLVESVHRTPPKRKLTTLDLRETPSGQPVQRPGGHRIGRPGKRGDPGRGGGSRGAPPNKDGGKPLSFQKLLLRMLPKGFRLNTQRRIPPRETGQRFDCAWVVYHARIGRIVLVQAPGTEAARDYLTRYPIPKGWVALLIGRPKTTVLLLSQCCTRNVLRQLSYLLAPEKK